MQCQRKAPPAAQERPVSLTLMVTSFLMRPHSISYPFSRMLPCEARLGSAAGRRLAGARERQGMRAPALSTFSSAQATQLLANTLRVGRLARRRRSPGRSRCRAGCRPAGPPGPGTRHLHTTDECTGASVRFQQLAADQSRAAAQRMQQQGSPPGGGAAGRACAAQRHAALPMRACAPCWSCTALLKSFR